MTRKAKIEADMPTMKRPAALGTKRVCPKCATKFYDFEREEADCPKCGHHINFRQDEPVERIVAPAPKKAAPKAVRQEDEDGAESGGTSSEFESLDDLDNGDDDELIEDLDSDDDEEEY